LILIRNEYNSDRGVHTFHWLAIVANFSKSCNRTSRIQSEYNLDRIELCKIRKGDRHSVYFRQRPESRAYQPFNKSVQPRNKSSWCYTVQIGVIRYRLVFYGRGVFYGIWRIWAIKFTAVVPCPLVVAHISDSERVQLGLAREMSPTANFSWRSS
jgi:hypothetical protein